MLSWIGRSHGLLKVEVTSFKSQRKASELTVNCAELKAAKWYNAL